ETLAQVSQRVRVEFSHFDWGADYYRQHGVMMPEDGLESLRDKDAILFGSAGDANIPDHITLWRLRLKICQGLDHSAIRTRTRSLHGISATRRHCQAGDLDWPMIRETSQGEYAGVGGRVHQVWTHETATDMSVMTRAGLARILRFALEQARLRPRK